ILSTVTDLAEPGDDPVFVSLGSTTNFQAFATGEATYQSFISSNNELFDTDTGDPGVTETPAITHTHSNAVGSATPMSGGPVFSNVVSVSRPYSLTTRIDLTLTSQNFGIDVDSTTTVLAPQQVIPAPPSAVLALGALPVLGLGWWLRRWRRGGAAAA
ncbi:MAG TPA: hypothetical protein VIL46_18485, partial [Gemmataceae bacterium]